MRLIELNDLDYQNKRILMRVDFNVPMTEDGQVADDTRIKAVLPTIEHLAKKGAKVILMSHLGRPTEGVFDPSYSLAPVADYLSTCLEVPVSFQSEWIEGFDLASGEVALCENVRFNEGEASNSTALAQKLAALCDIFVMDAFATAHRAQASTHGVAVYAPMACAGPLLLSELKALKQACSDPKRPLVAIVGGAKVSSKLSILKALAEKVDQLIVGGGIANTFLAATGQNIGTSLFEPTLVSEAKEILASIAHEGGFMPLPVDVKTSKTFGKGAPADLKLVSEVEADDQILDIGPQTAEQLCDLLKNAGTIIWNGPVGVFEFDSFGEGTKAIAEAIANSEAFSLAGGGDTLAAIAKYKLADRLGYISTGGGAFLEYVEGKTLPAVSVLHDRAESFFKESINET